MDERKRSQNWTEDERVSAIEAIHQNAETLFCKFRGSSQGAKAKEDKWQEIALGLNAAGKTSCLRSTADIKKMYSNMKSRVKEKYDRNKKTGGGAHVGLSPAEDFVLQHLLSFNRESVEGIQHGIDSFQDDLDGFEVFPGNNIIISTAEHTATGRGDASDAFGCTPHVDVQSNSCITGVKKTKSSKRQVEERESNLYNLERKRIEAEIKKIEAEELYYKEKMKREEFMFSLKKRKLLKELEQ